MYQMFLKAKLHHARVTHSELEYEGSCAIDAGLLGQAGIQEYEQLHVYNLENGNRFVTYAIKAEERSGIISVNGAAAHKADKGDRLIICTYAGLTPQEAAKHRPNLVYLDEHNKVIRSSRSTPVQVA